MIVLDGPMGTELAARGVPTPAPGWSAYAIESAPAIVSAVHRDYAAAGATVHRANTFRTQPRIFPDRYATLIDRAVALARGAVGPARVAGSIGPIEDCYRPDLAPADAEARAAHRAVAEALAASGVDLLICETFPSAREAAIVVEEAARTGKETWATLTAGPDGSLMTPEAMERAARDCVSAGATRVLVNCTAATLTLAYVDRLSRVGVPFGAYANAGAAADRLGFCADPDVARYAALARSWIAAGASVVGACCGTAPVHVAALAALAE